MRKNKSRKSFKPKAKLRVEAKDKAKALKKLPTEKRGAAQGLTPLAMAIKNNRIDVVKVLIDKGANLNTPIDYGPYEGFTPVALAICLQRLEALNLLLEWGADCGAPIPFGPYKDLTPLAIAVLMLINSAEKNQQNSPKAQRSIEEFYSPEDERGSNSGAEYESDPDTDTEIIEEQGSDEEPIQVRQTSQSSKGQDTEEIKLNIIEILINSDAAFNFPVHNEVWHGRSVEEQVWFARNEQVIQILDNELFRMSDQLELFSDFLADRVSHSIRWVFRYDGYHYLRVLGDPLEMIILKTYLESFPLCVICSNDETILYIKKDDVFSLLHNFEGSSLDWVSSFSEMKFSLMIKPDLEKIIGKNQAKLEEDYLILECSGKNFFKIKKSLILLEAELKVGQEFSSSFETVVAQNCFRIPRDHVFHEKGAKIFNLIKEGKENSKHLKLFLDLAQKCGPCTFENKDTSQVILFSNKKSEERFRGLVDPFFAQGVERYSYEAILNIREGQFTKKFARLERLKKLDELIETKVRKFQEVMSSLILKFQFDIKDTLLLVAKVKPKFMAIFRRMQRELKCELFENEEQISFDKRHLASLSDVQMANIKLMTELNLNKIHKFASALRLVCKFKKNDPYGKSGIEFSCESSALSMLQGICGEMLKKDPKNSDYFLISYEKILELSIESIVGIFKFIEEFLRTKVPDFLPSLPPRRVDQAIANMGGSSAQERHVRESQFNKRRKNKKDAAPQRGKLDPAPQVNSPEAQKPPVKKSSQDLIAKTLNVNPDQMDFCKSEKNSRVGAAGFFYSRVLQRELPIDESEIDESEVLDLQPFDGKF